MKRLLFLLAALLLLPAAASAQTWVFDSDFPATRQFSSVHGMAVDGEGKVWIQYFGATERIIARGTPRNTNVVYVFNADGSEASFSPIKYVNTGGVIDTVGVFTNATGALEGRSGRGLGVDADGNILISQFATIFKVDHRSSVNTTDSTVVGIAKVNPFGNAAITSVGSDDQNNVYVTTVSPLGSPIRVYSPDLTSFESASAPTRGFNRAVLASADGLNVFRFDYTTPFTTVFSRPDEFSAFDSLGVTMRGFRTESAAINVATGDLWFAAGSPLDLPNQDPEAVTWWQQESWYGFALSDLVSYTNGVPTGTIEIPVPRDSLRWANTLGVGRPRGIGFSPDGLSAYIGEFSQPAPSAQKQTKTGVAVEPGAPGIPEGFSLQQNSPNPFGASTTISFGIESAAHVRLRVLDTAGREVGVLVDEALTAGNYDASFDADGLAAGIYVYVLEVDGRPMSRRMLVLR
jgi:hypothetical protein